MKKNVYVNNGGNIEKKMKDEKEVKLKVKDIEVGDLFHEELEESGVKKKYLVEKTDDVIKENGTRIVSARIMYEV